MRTIPIIAHTQKIPFSLLDTLPRYTSGDARTLRTEMSRLNHIQKSRKFTIALNFGSQCFCMCRDCHLQSSPTNTRLSFLTEEDMRPICDQIMDVIRAMPDVEITILGTGGEPFMNPHIISILSLLRRELPQVKILLLDTCTHTLTKRSAQLAPLLDNNVEIRVSIDHPDLKKHFDNRYNPSLPQVGWEKIVENMIKGVTFLSHETTCRIGITGRHWDEDYDSRIAQYMKLIEYHTWRISPDDINIFPADITNHDMNGDADFSSNGVTSECFRLYNKTRDDLMCSNSLMIVKHRGSSKTSIQPCTIIPYNQTYRFEGTILEAIKTPFRLVHENCNWCLAGGNCSG